MLTEQGDAPEREGQDRRLILFAIFFDAAKTLAQGRKVPAALACSYPNLRDVSECLARLNIPFEFQARAPKRR
jgi:signal recognition particle subunit SEC65